SDGPRWRAPRTVLVYRHAVRRTPRPVKVTVVVAIVVAVAALATAAVLRMQRTESARADATTGPVAGVDDVAAKCGENPCEVLTSVPVGQTTVELLADANGRHGRLRFLEPDGASLLGTALADMDVRLTQKSLSCFQGPTSACLVRGGRDGGVIGEVFVRTGGGWTTVEQPYYSEAGLVDLAQITGDRSPEVAVAKVPGCAGQGHLCRKVPIRLHVYGLDGSPLGCSATYSSLTQVPGWPDIALSDWELRDCP